MTEHRVLEFYAGIGGMHHGLRMSRARGTVLAAFDIDESANKVYHHNFPDVVQCIGAIETFRLTEFESFNADVFLMSPPCQPFTRNGKQQGSQDPRCRSFLFLLRLINTMKNPPAYILIENVKGFETSETHDQLLEALRTANYDHQEFLLSPHQFGIPNSRLRYFAVCARAGLSFRAAPTATILTQIPGCALHTLDCRRIFEFLDPATETNADVLRQHIVPEKTVCRYGRLFDIILPTDSRSICFTKGYTQYAEGTGSVLQLADAPRAVAFSDHYLLVDGNVEKGPVEPPDPTEASPQARDRFTISHEPDQPCPLMQLRLRYFTAKEMANVHMFPPEFSFPGTVTPKQQRRLVGNSLNALVVSELINFMLDV